MAQEENDRGFKIKDCALTAIATGRRAMNLRELRDIVQDIHPGSIYYHFWSGLLRPGYAPREYNNDFAAWAFYGLHDLRLAERLSVIDPTGGKDLESLRQELIDVVEERLDETEMVPWARRDRQFYFVRSQIVVFDTRVAIEQPEGLADVVKSMSTSSIFYHFIDARRRSDAQVDDFRAWLGGFTPRYDDLCSQLACVDPYFETLPELRDQLSAIMQDYFGGLSP